MEGERVSKLVSAIVGMKEELLKGGYVVQFKDGIVFSQKFYEMLGHKNKVDHVGNGIAIIPANRDAIYDSIRGKIATVKKLYTPGTALTTSKLNKACEEMRDIYMLFLKGIFRTASSPRAPIPYVIVKPGGDKMRVGDFSEDGLKGFAKAMVSPNVDLIHLQHSVIKTYSKPDWDTGTIGKYFANGKWVTPYNEYVTAYMRGDRQDPSKMYNVYDQDLDDVL